MRYCLGKYRQFQLKKLHDIYVTDCLKIIAENTARAVNEGSYLKSRYIDIIEPKSDEEQTEKADAIITDFLQAVEHLERSGNN